MILAWRDRCALGEVKRKRKIKVHAPHRVLVPVINHTMLLLYMSDSGQRSSRLDLSYFRVHVCSGLVFLLLHHPEPGDARLASLHCHQVGLAVPQGPGRCPAESHGTDQMSQGVEGMCGSPGREGQEGSGRGEPHGELSAGKCAAELACCHSVCAVEPSCRLSGACGAFPGHGS